MPGTKDVWEYRLFPHEVSNHLRVSPMITYRGIVSPNGRQAESSHPFFTWWWFEKGSVEVMTRSERFIVEAGQWILIPCGLWRRQDFQPSAEIISINFLASWQENSPLIRANFPFVGERQTVPGLIDAAERVTGTLDPLEDGTKVTLQTLPLSRRFQLTAAIYEFANLLFQHAVSQGAEITATPFRDIRIDWVIRDLHHNLRAGPLPFTRWEERTCLSRSQLERLARKHLNQSLHAYRDNLLASATCRALTSEHALVKQVAEQFGFVDTAHFCRWLKAKTGYSPATFRQAAVV